MASQVQIPFEGVILQEHSAPISCPTPNFAKGSDVSGLYPAWNPPGQVLIKLPCIVRRQSKKMIRQAGKTARSAQDKNGTAGKRCRIAAVGGFCMGLGLFDNPVTQPHHRFSGQMRDDYLCS